MASSNDSPIDKIPDELLALVFVHLDDRTSLPNHKPIPHILSSVDRRWRRVAIDLSSLWSHIILSFEKFTLSPSIYIKCQSLWIERSRTSPLDISIDLINLSGPLRGYEKLLLNLVLPNIGRWRYLNVVADHARDLTNFSIAMYNAAPAPLLRKAVITTRHMIITELMDNMEDEIYHSHKAFFRSGSPSLGSVCLVGIHYFQNSLYMT